MSNISKSHDALRNQYFKLKEELHKKNISVTPVHRESFVTSTPIYDEKTLNVVWLHREVSRWWDTYKQEQKCKAWTTDAKEGGNPVTVEEITAWMYGFWDDGNKTTQETAVNASSVETKTKLQQNFPWPGETPYQVCGKAWCKGPIIKGKKSCVG